MLQCRKHSHCFSASACDFQRLPTSTGVLRGPDQPAGQTLLRADGLVFLGSRGRWDRRSGREASPVLMDVYLGTWGLGGPRWGQETRLPPPGTWQATPCLVSTGHRTDPGLRGQPPAWGSLGPASGQGSHPGRRQLSGAGEGVVLQGRSTSSSQARVRAQGHQRAHAAGRGRVRESDGASPRSRASTPSLAPQLPLGPQYLLGCSRMTRTYVQTPERCPPVSWECTCLRVCRRPRVREADSQADPPQVPSAAPPSRAAGGPPGASHPRVPSPGHCRGCPSGLRPPGL